MVSALPTAGGVAGYFRNGTSADGHEADQRRRVPSTGRAEPADPAERAGGDQGDQAAEGDADGERAGQQAPGALVARGRPRCPRPRRRRLGVAVAGGLVVVGVRRSRVRRPPPRGRWRVSTWGSPTWWATRKAARPASRPASRPRTRNARAVMIAPPSVAGVAEQVPSVVDPLVDRVAGRDGDGALVGADEEDDQEPRAGRRTAPTGRSRGGGSRGPRPGRRWVPQTTATCVLLRDTCVPVRWGWTDHVGLTSPP